jgi:hypothetical protein
MFILEIIALIFLCKKNGNLAAQKGLNPVKWKWYTVLAWIVAEMVGIILAMSFYGQEEIIKQNIISISFFGLISAFGGYLFVKFLLEKKPDAMDEEINSIGADDLHPPRK